MTISVGKEFGQTSVQAVHKKQLSNISFAFLSSSKSPRWYAPSRSIKPLGDVVSSALTMWIVHTGMHFPHLMQSSLVAEKLKISSGF